MLSLKCSWLQEAALFVQVYVSSKEFSLSVRFGDSRSGPSTSIRDDSGRPSQLHHSLYNQLRPLWQPHGESASASLQSCPLTSSWVCLPNDMLSEWHVQAFSHVQLFVTLWTIAHQAPLSMEFSRQEYSSGLPFPSPGDLPTQGPNPCLWCLLHWQADSLPLCHLGSHISLEHLLINLCTQCDLSQFPGNSA